MSYQVNLNYTVNPTINTEYTKVELVKPEFHFNKTTLNNVAKIIIPTLICLTRPVLQRLEDAHQVNSRLTFGQKNIQSLALGSYFNMQYEMSAINMTETQQTIENTKEIEFIYRTLSGIDKKIDNLATKADLEKLTLTMKVDKNQKIIDRLILIGGIAFTAIVAPIIVLVVQFYFFTK